MTRSINLLLGTVAAAAIVAAAAPAFAEEVSFGPETYSVQNFDAENFIGNVEIIVENRSDIEISAVGEDELMEYFEIETTGNSVKMLLTRDDFSWTDGGSNVHNWSFRSFFRRGDNDGELYRLEDFPTVTVRVPSGTDVDLDDVAGRLTAGDLNGAFAMNSSGSMRATIGDVSSAEVGASGSGTIVLGDVSGGLEAVFSGSADLTVGTSQNASVRISGSSDIDLGAIASAFEVSVSGSGDVRAASINGNLAVNVRGSGSVIVDEGHASNLEINTSGSGGVRFGGEAGDTSIETRGSGGVRVASVDGRVEARTSGSGDIHISDGQADGFDASTRGSGDIYFGGTATNANVSSTGSGDVTIEHYEGRYKHSSLEAHGALAG